MENAEATLWFNDDKTLHFKCEDGDEIVIPVSRKEGAYMTENQKNIEAAISSLQDEYKKESQRAEYMKMAENLRMIYQSFVDVGFTDIQAWELIYKMMPTLKN